MNILVFNGSPHVNGNTAAVLKQISSSAEEMGASTKLVNLNQLKIKGCQACYGCQKENSAGECVMADDLQPLYKEIREADAIVLGSSIFMGQMTSQAKQFFDRFFAFLRPDFSSHIKNKKTALVFVHGQADENLYRSYIDQTAFAFESMGFPIIDIIIGSGVPTPGMAAENTTLMEKAKFLGHTLAQGA